VWSLVALSSCIVLMTACTGSQTNVAGGAGQGPPPPPPVPTYTLVQTQTACQPIGPNEGGDPLRVAMDSARWPYGCVPLYTDDQRLNDGTGGYGPLAHAAPLQGSNYTDKSNFEVAIQYSPAVGIVVVDTLSGTQLPPTYQGLLLKAGVNCVFFRHDPGTPQPVGWHAYINQPVAGKCQAPTVATGAELPVNVFHSGGFATQDNYPAVGRFHEAVKQPGGQPVALIGFKCAAAYCFVQPSTSMMHSDHVGVTASLMTWEVHGWGDEQHVGVPLTPGANVHPQWTYNASILPAARIDTLKIAHFNNDTVFVAEIYLKEPPPPGSKYDTKWHLIASPGHNYIFLTHKTGMGDNVGWTGIIRHTMNSAPGAQWPLNIVRHDHSPLHVLGTARLAWSETDEDGWVRCDDGCCYLSGKS